MTIHADLYDTDFYAWCEEQAALLTRQDPWALDWANLAEEIRSIARRDKRALGQSSAGTREASPVDGGTDTR